MLLGSLTQSMLEAWVHPMLVEAFLYHHKVVQPPQWQLFLQRQLCLVIASCVSGHSYPTPPEMSRACCRLCLRVGLSPLTQSPANGPEVPSSAKHYGHHVTGDSIVQLLLPWETACPCPPCHLTCLCPQFSDSRAGGWSTPLEEHSLF